MDQIYVNAYRHSDTTFSVNLETLIIINVYKICYCQETKLRLNIKLTPEEPVEFVKVDFNSILYNIVETVPDSANYCIWPVITKHNYVIAGLCSVARQMIKSSNNENANVLLGFREACLMACSESSIWTKFCEVDIVSTIKNLLKLSKNCPTKTFTLPSDLLRFEYHMSQPVRMHNIYKIARETNNNKDINSGLPVDQLNLHHIYGEGPFMTLADVILFPCYQILFTICNESILRDNLPLTFNWFRNMQNQLSTKLILMIEQIIDFEYVSKPEIVKQSLYTADPTRYKPGKRIYTKQKDITNSLCIINNKNIEMRNNLYPYGDDVNFSWSKIPLEATPMGGALPEKRAHRKSDQLENLVKAVLKIVGDKRLKIVDFCSGSGHLGILIAYLLPNCEVILVENKEQSLIRARNRILKMNLVNLIVLQSNIDYFIGDFNVGVSLHACGVATDLVIQNCITKRASFVCCPCCYGGIHDCYHLTYPRSEDFRNLDMNIRDYLTLAHAADQTHDTNNRKTTQGFLCMDAIDTDRRLYAESCGYEVHLGKLMPVSCTNKNNLLVGIINASDKVIETRSD